MTSRIALTIAGSDPSGGAGIQADLKTFHRFGVYGEAVVTLVTAQNTRAVSRVEILAPDLVEDQIEAVLEDMPPHAAKTGALGNVDLVHVVAACAARFRFALVVDPVMISKQGARLVSEAAVAAIRSDLLPFATLVTPNLVEAEELTGRKTNTVASMKDAARALFDLGAKAALVKGGHLDGEPIDVLFDGAFYEYSAERLPTPHTHGTGCTYSAAITAGLALGNPLHEAITHAKSFVTRAIRTAPGIGSGQGPLNHFA